MIWTVFWIVYAILVVPTLHMAFIQQRIEWFEYAEEKAVKANGGRPVTAHQVQAIERDYRRIGRPADISVAIGVAMFAPVTFFFYLAHSPYGRDVRPGGVSLEGHHRGRS